ncbi:hypothetical protein AcW1_001685 [Taiwanofungus camphoratus]|nr:hypothetical protein AcV7_001543 [Antrodia cinnamomea]KAI0945470.1 hypothetical protein AcW1_001685 [Antrodia cinnamomea]
MHGRKVLWHITSTSMQRKWASVTYSAEIPGTFFTVQFHRSESKLAFYLLAHLTFSRFVVAALRFGDESDLTISVLCLKFGSGRSGFPLAFCYTISRHFWGAVGDRVQGQLETRRCSTAFQEW